MTGSTAAARSSPEREGSQPVVATFVLMLREGLEAALIVGIIAAYLVKVGRRDALPPVFAGVLGAVGLSIVAGVAIVLTVGRLPLVVQETFEGAAGLAAVAVLTWMLFWMRRQGRALKGELQAAIDRALRAGVGWESIVVDPGFGFGKTAEHNLALLRDLAALRILGRPILLGTSRKSTLGKVLDLPPDERVEATVATTVLGIAAGVDVVRVHDVRANVRAARMADAIVRGAARVR